MNKDGDDVQKAMEKLGESGQFPGPQDKIDALTDNMAVPGPNEEAFFEERRRMGLGVGLDDHGDLVNASDRVDKKPSAHERE